MDVDTVTAVVAVVASVVAVATGVERWLLPARRMRQYEMLTTMRKEEPEGSLRWESLSAARTRTAAQLLGSFWVPAYRIALFVPVVVGAYAASVALAIQNPARYLVWFCMATALSGVGWWRVLHWFGVRQHLIGDYIRGGRTSAVHYRDDASVFGWAASLTLCSVIGSFSLGGALAYSEWNVWDWVAVFTNAMIPWCLWAVYADANRPAALSGAQPTSKSAHPWRDWRTARRAPRGRHDPGAE